MKHFVIEIKDQEGNVSYIGGSTEGSKYSIVYSLKSALWFDTEKQTNEVFDHEEFTKRNEYSGGTSAPPSLIWLGLGICNTRPIGKGTVSVIYLSTGIIKATPIQDELLGN